MKSLVIGFCECAKCHWTDNKFNWHVYFKCPMCDSTEYVKWKDPFYGEKNENNSGAVFNNNSIDDSVSVWQ